MLATVRHPSVDHIMKTTPFDSKEKAEAALAVLEYLEGEGTSFFGLPGEYHFNMRLFSLCIGTRKIIPNRTFLDKLLFRRKYQIVKVYSTCAFGLFTTAYKEISGLKHYFFITKSEDERIIYSAYDLKRHEVARLWSGYLHTGKADIEAAKD